jgi:hypothetical protein
MQKWEYQILTDSGFDPKSRNCLYRLNGTLTEANSDSFVDVLNHAGQQGWEAFAAVQDDDSITYVLKRPTK